MIIYLTGFKGNAFLLFKIFLKKALKDIWLAFLERVRFTAKDMKCRQQCGFWMLNYPKNTLFKAFFRVKNCVYLVSCKQRQRTESKLGTFCAIWAWSQESSWISWTALFRLETYTLCFMYVLWFWVSSY